MRILFSGITATLLLAGSVSAQNLLTNGSFEDPDVDPGTAQVFLGSITGWTDEGICGIEVQDTCCGSPAHGDQHLELDSDCPSTISQTVATQPGAKYLLSLAFSPRPGVIDNHLIVRWNGSTVFDLTAGSLGTETEWQNHSAVLTATGTTSTVEFSADDQPDGVGTYIDNVPEPGRSAQLAAGLSLLAGLTFLRRRTPRSRPRGRSR